MDEHATNQSYKYRIRVKETLDRQFNGWIGNLTITPLESGETILESSFTDQPALRGFLEGLWNLNITIISVERIENES